MAARVIAPALAAFGLGGPLAAAATRPTASGADLQLVQASFSPARTEDTSEQWLAAEQSADTAQCAAPVGNGYCDMSSGSMTYGKGGSCTGQYCAGLSTLQQCCDVVAAMPACAEAPHVGFIPAVDSQSVSACGCCTQFKESSKFMAEFYSVETEAREVAHEEKAAGQDGVAVGDPHLQNIYGQRFDLMQPGRHTLIRIPAGAPDAAALLLGVSAKVRQVGAACSDMYFKELNVTGAWAEAKQAGGFQFRAEEASSCDGESWKMSLGDGKLDLKVAHGCTSQGARYLNFYVKHLGRVGMAVGGLLGEDDHTAAATPQERCQKMLTLSSDYRDAAEGGPLGPNGPAKRD